MKYICIFHVNWGNGTSCSSRCNIIYRQFLIINNAHPMRINMLIIIFVDLYNYV